MRAPLLLLAVAASIGFAWPGEAADHLVNASVAPGAAQRGFANPITDNTHGNAAAVSNGDAAPGTGDPKLGEDLGTPAVEVDALHPTAQTHVPFGD